MREVGRDEERRVIYESGNWWLTPMEAARLVGGLLFLHDAKAKPSYLGGRVLSFREVFVPEKAHPNRVVLRFVSSAECQGVPWDGDDYMMAWYSGIVVV